jgi:uncharacterized protein DUF3592
MGCRSRRAKDSMLKRRQYSLAYLFACITGIAVAAGFIRLCFFWGERLLWWLSVLLATIVGGSLTILAAWMTFHAIRVVTRWPRASATIVRYAIRRYDKQPFYHAVVKFTSHDGKPIVAIWSSGYRRRYWPRGTVVPVRYAPQNLRWIEILVPSNLWGFVLPFFLNCFLLFILLIGYMLPKYYGKATMFDFP